MYLSIILLQKGGALDDDSHDCLYGCRLVIQERDDAITYRCVHKILIL